MNKIGKVVRTQCVCGRHLNPCTGLWQGATKEQSKLDRDLADKGLLIVKVILCPQCRKTRVQQCVCGRIKRREDWEYISRLAEQSLKEYVGKGSVEIERTMCPECKEAREGK